MSDLLTLLTHQPLLAGGYVFILGLCVGSFLNVVIYRLPVMLEQHWEDEAHTILQLAPKERPSFNLITPRSRCPHCGHQIAAWENIPVISWLILKGRCHACKSPISLRYPLIEIASGLLSLAVFLSFGPTGKMLAALVLTWALIALTMIDFDTQLLPDDITLPLLWLGLLLNINGLFTSLHDAVIGAAAGYLLLWSVYWLFKLITGREGMGYGDFKLLAALGAWFGWMHLPSLLLISSCVGSLVGIGYWLVRRESAPFAFGPYIALAGMVSLFIGNDLSPWLLGK